MLSTGRSFPSKMEAVRLLLNHGRTNKDIARVIYDDETERGQRRVRAIRSKLRKSGKLADTSINSNEDSFATEEKRAEKGEEGKTDQKTQELSQPSCGGVVASQLRLSQPSVGGFEVVRAPVAGLGSRVGYVLERDIVTAVLWDSVAARAVQRLAQRLTGAGFYVYHDNGVAFQSKGDVVSISEPNGDLNRSAEVLKHTLRIATNLSVKEIERIASRVKHPSEISNEELTVNVTDSEMIQIIRQCEPHIPDAGRGPYVILSPSPLLPGLKIYLPSPSCVRIELVAHNEKQAFNAFFMRGELVGDVLSHIKKSPGVFDEWRAQYWHPYSHPMVVNLNVDMGSLIKAGYKGRGAPSRSDITFDSLPDEIRKAIINLRDNGILYFNDYGVYLSDKAKRLYRKDPSNIMRELECADSLEREVTLILLQKVAVDCDTLLEHMRKEVIVDRRAHGFPAKRPGERGVSDEDRT